MYNPAFRQPHFSHYQHDGVVCPGDKWDKKSEWHYCWQKCLSPPDIEIEVSIQCDNYLKRADIRLKNGRVVEVQRSSMPSAELLHLEKFYRDMFWIIHPDLCHSGLWSGYSKKTFLIDLSANLGNLASNRFGLCIGLMRCNCKTNCSDCPRYIQKNDFITQCLKDCIHPQEIYEKQLKTLDEQKKKIKLEQRSLELEKRKRVQLWEDSQRKEAEDRALLSKQWQDRQRKRLENREKMEQAKLKKLAKEREIKQNELKNNNPNENRKEWDERNAYWQAIHERCCGIKK